MILNRERVLNRLSQLSHEAQKMGHYSAAARCEELIGKEIGMLTNRSILDIEPSQLSPEILDALLDHVLKKVAGPAVTPEMLAEIRKQLEAVVPVEAVYQVQGDVPESRGE